MEDDPDSQALLKAGYHNLMSVACGLRGPRGPLFKRSIQNYLFTFHGYFGAAVSVYLTVEILTTYATATDLEFTKEMFLLVPLITGTHSNINFFYMEYCRPRFIRMLRMNEEASKDKFYEEGLQEEIKLWAARARKLQPLLYFIVSAPVFPWGMSPILNPSRRDVAFDLWFPYDINDLKYWVLTLCIQTTAGFYATLQNVMFDAVFFCFTFRILALLVHLKKTFKHIFHVIHVNAAGHVFYTDYSGRAAYREEIEDQLTERLTYWISQHQATMRLLNELEALYSIPLLFHFIHAGSVLATGAAVLVKGNLPLGELYFVTVHLLGLIATLFVICRIGDLLKTQTSEILDGLAGKNYFMLSKYQRTILKTLLIGSKEPFVVRVVQTFPLNTETFKSIIATTYSFFTLFQKAKG
uniref:Odorant receptor n=1 Tax=Cyrtorhinus lividipennis TaxID=1032904 RepID=A0A346TI09_9HEMI|nr:odorant receptor 1 [Cyrtorhinus lividipennis]